VVEALVGVYAEPLWADNREVLLNTTSSLAYFVLDLGMCTLSPSTGGSIVKTQGLFSPPIGRWSNGPVAGQSRSDFAQGRLTHMVPFLITGFADVKVELVKCLSHILQSGTSPPPPQRASFRQGHLPAAHLHLLGGRGQSGTTTRVFGAAGSATPVSGSSL
jgi:hypothetical protein